MTSRCRCVARGARHDVTDAECTEETVLLSSVRRQKSFRGKLSQGKERAGRAAVGQEGMREAENKAQKSAQNHGTQSDFQRRHCARGCAQRLWCHFHWISVPQGRGCE